MASTERRARLGDDAFDEFSKRFIATLRDEVTRSGGREITNLGDGLMAVWTESTADAVACATAMHRTVAGLDSSDPPRLRVGISSGEVAQVGDEYSGMPIVEAARLEAAAPPGRTLANAVVRALVGTRRDLRFRDVGALSLKGIPVPLVTVEVIDDEGAVVSGLSASPLPASPLHASLPASSLPQPGRPLSEDRAFSSSTEGRESLSPRWGSGSIAVENVAVVVADVVEPAGVLTQTADDMRRSHLAVLRQAIAETVGQEVKSRGRSVMVVFPSTSAAISCAVAMQQGIEREGRGVGHASGLRVGLSVGEVSIEHGDHFGDPVIEATELCASCAEGQILATDMVRLMAGRRSRHACNPAGARELAGLPEPVQTVEVAWEPVDRTVGSSVPLPGRLSPRAGVRVVGREEEIGELASAFKRVDSGQGRETLLISGEAGMGKTTLLARAAQSAFDQGACVLFGHCEEDMATPYQLFGEALNHYVTHASEQQLLDHVEEHGGELARLVPALGSRFPDLPASRATDSDTERYVLFAAVVGLLAMISRSQPVVLVLDDLQWADSASLQLLRHLSAAEQPLRVLVLGSYRNSRLTRSHRLLETLAALRRQPGVSRIDLSGLDEPGVVSLMEAAAGHSLDDAGSSLACALCRETDGNPFFVTEMLRHLNETGKIYQDESGHWTTVDDLGDAALPDSVREVICSRVGRLGHEAERVLSAAAVIGRDFDLDVLARTTEVSEDELLDVLDAASAVDLVYELPGIAGRYNFAHALIQHTLYVDMGSTRRARAHKRVAESLEDLCGANPGTRVGELARHWVAATQPIDLAKAIAYSRQAGDAALRSLAPQDALGYYTQALELVGRADDPDQVLGIDLAIGLGTAQRQTGDPAFRETLLDTARRAADLGDTERLVAAAMANDRGFSVLGNVDADKVEILELALGLLPEDHPDRALVLAKLCQDLTYGSPLDRRQSLAEEAIAIAEASGDDATIVRVLNHISYPLLVPPLLDQSLSNSANAMARAERVGDPVLRFWAASQHHTAAACSGNIDEVDRCLELLEELAGQLNQPTLKWRHTVMRSTRAQLAGDTARAEELATEAFQIGNSGGEPDAAALFGTQMMSVSLQRGTLVELVPLIEEVAAEHPGVTTFMAALAMAHVEGGKIDAACRLLQKFSASGLDLPLDATWTIGMNCYAEAAIECRDLTCAAPLLDRLRPWADRLSYSGVSTAGPVVHVLGGLASVLGRFDEADAYFAQSSKLSARIGAKFFAARTDLSWGRMLIERRAPGDLDRARDLLARAHDAAVAHGYAVVQRRAADALHEVGP
ncbi:MAG: AAA family ATPase [Acidimicrobiales bacterium]